MYVVWALSFDKDYHDQLVAAGFVDLLESFPVDHAGVKRGIEGALWNLQPEKRPEPSSGPKVGRSGHVMISYSWGQKERMRELAFHLKEAGLPIWIDVEKMEGSILKKMGSRGKIGCDGNRRLGNLPRFAGVSHGGRIWPSSEETNDLCHGGGRIQRARVAWIYVGRDPVVLSMGESCGL